MKNNFYLNSILTIIAFCLIGIFIQNQILINRVSGSEVIRTSEPRTQPVHKVGNYAIVPVNEDGSIDVKIKGSSETIDVDITGISTTDEFDVNIEQVSGYDIPKEVPVKVK